MTQASPTPEELAVVAFATALVRDCRALPGLGWPSALLARCTDSFEDFADSLSRAGADVASLREPALALYACLDAITAAGGTPSAERAAELAKHADHMADAMPPALADACRRTRHVDLLSATAGFPPALEQALLRCGLSPRHFADADAMAQAAQVAPGAVLLVDVRHLAGALAVQDVMAEEVPACAATPVLAIGNGNPGGRLEALMQGADAYAASLDDDELVTQLNALAQVSPEPPGRVLVVDDDAVASARLRVMLEQGGLQVEVCADAQSAPARVAEQPPDLLMVALTAGGLDGLGLTLGLRQQPALALLPILVLSHDEREQVRMQAIHVGADGVLHQPVQARALLTEVHSRIKRARVIRRQLPTVIAAAPLARRGGQLRRGDFLAQMAEVLREPGGAWPVLLAVKVDQAEAVGKNLGLSGVHELEQALLQRCSELLVAEDACTLWLEFGFGILVQRERREDIVALAEGLCRAVAARPFKVKGVDTRLTLSIGLALPPTGAGADNPDRWFAAAYAGMSIAHRLGGDRHDGVLSREHGDMPAERVLIIREFVKNAARGEHIVIEYQPMLPLRDAGAGIYAVITKLRDFRAPLAGIRREEYLEAAREAKALAMIERAGVFSAFEAIQEERSKKRGTRFLVPMDLVSLDGPQMGWLTAELRRRKAQADGLVIEFDAAPLLADPALASSVQQLKDCGITLCVSEPSGSLARLEPLYDLPVDLLRLPYSAIDDVSAPAFAELLAPWRAKGRGVVIDHVHKLDAMAQLWELGIDYLQGDVLAASGPRLDFDFGQGGEGNR